MRLTLAIASRGGLAERAGDLTLHAMSTVRAGVTATFRAFLARYPRISADRLIQTAGIEPHRIGDADAVIDQRQWVALLEAAADATGDPGLGLELALQVPWKDFGVLGYVLLNSPTVGAALENSARFLAVQQTGGRLVLATGPRVARFTYAMADPRIVEYGQNAESVFGLTVRLIREATVNPRWAPREVTFRHDRPSDPSRQEQFFAAPTRFAQRTNTLVLAPDDLARRFVSADPGLLPLLIAHATASLAQLPRGGEITDEVRAAVIAAIGAGDASIEAVASRLGQSTRSLQRRLQQARASFHAIVEEARLALAKRYLADPALSLTETAFLLGYSDLSAFSRAFRRWTGTTAHDYRRRLE